VSNNINLIVDLINSSKLAEARINIENELKYNKNDFLLYNLYGFILLKENRHQDAIIKFKKSIDINPMFFEGFYNIGTSYLKISDYENSLFFLLKAIELEKSNYNCNFNIAEVYKNLKKYDKAKEHYKICLELNDKDHEVYNNLALIYKIEKNYNEAISCLKESIKINPEYYQSYNNLGSCYLDTRNYEEAIIYFKKCIDLKNDFVLAYINLGRIYIEQEKFIAATFFLKQALLIDNNQSEIYYNLAISLSKSGNIMESINLLESSSFKNNKIINAHLADSYCKIGKIEKGIEIYRNLIDKISEEDELKFFLESYIFNLSYLNDLDLKEYFYVIEEYKKKILKKLNFFKSHPKSNDKIKVGFLSSDFKVHAVGFQIIDVIKTMSSFKDIEIYAYSNSKTIDDFTRNFKKIFKFWNNIEELNDIETLKLINSDSLDVLFDLGGFSAGNRLNIFYNKPALIQISWAGYLASTGLNEIDYIIADEKSVPKKHEENQFVEQILRFSDVWSVLSDHNIPFQNELPALKKGYFTFGSFSNPKKINNSVVKLWAKILNKCLNSKLILKSPSFDDESLKKNFIQYFLNEGVQIQNLIIEGDSERNLLLKRYNDVDITLDPFPYGGGTTSLESISMGVPVLSKEGKYFLSRCGSSINYSLGLKDWVCENDNDYFLKAVNFFENLDTLKKTRHYLYTNKNKFTIFNSELFAGKLVAEIKKKLQRN
jgi:protein O-GlcNAc transferase